MTIGQSNKQDVEVKEHFEVAGRDDIGSKRVIITGDDGLAADTLSTDGHTGLVVSMPGFVDLNNSTETLLLADETYLGTATDIANFSAISLLVYSDVASAEGGLIVQFSPDGSDWFDGEAYTIPAGKTKFFTPPVQSRYYRISYTNGGTDQSSFHLHPMVKQGAIKWSSHNLTSNLDDEDDATLSLAVLKLRTAQDNYVSGAATNGGNFKVSLEEIESSISDDTNSSLKVSPYIHNENGTVSRMLGDTIFQGSLVCITPEHHEIHCGDSYVVSRTVDLGNGAVDDLLIMVPNETGSGQVQKLYHLLPAISTESEAHAYLYEAPTISVTGTAVTSYNRNRNSTNSSSLSVYHTPTATGGTLLLEKHFGSGKGVGGNGRSDEFVLKNNTSYLLRISNSTALANYISWELNYYVHPGI